MRSSGRRFGRDGEHGAKPQGDRTGPTAPCRWLPDRRETERHCTAPVLRRSPSSIDVFDAMRAAGGGWDEITACRATGLATNAPVRCLFDLSVQSNEDRTSQRRRRRGQACTEHRARRQMDPLQRASSRPAHELLSGCKTQSSQWMPGLARRQAFSETRGVNARQFAVTDVTEPLRITGLRSSCTKRFQDARSAPDWARPPAHRAPALQGAYAVSSTPTAAPVNLHRQPHRSRRATLESFECGWDASRLIPRIAARPARAVAAGKQQQQPCWTLKPRVPGG